MQNSFRSSGAFQVQPTSSPPNPSGYYKWCTADGRFCVICQTYFEPAQNRWVRMCWHNTDGRPSGADGEYL